MGGASRSGCVLDLAMPNLDERRIVAWRKAGKWHVIIYDGPTTPEDAGNRRREAVGGAGFKNFGHPYWEKKTKVSCTPCVIVRVVPGLVKTKS